ncbi:MAG: toll/interleukin-1 receptor domain-containing protein [Acidobacteria bacterium]|nr:toll/interleukin-1 receptor domain-containing protein [Acidobacteriota bacterium]
MKKIFISYSHKDTAFKDQLKARLWLNWTGRWNFN